MANFREVLTQAAVPNRVGAVRPSLVRDPGAKLITGAIQTVPGAYGGQVGQAIEQAGNTFQAIGLDYLHKQQALAEEMRKQDAANESALAFARFRTEVEEKTGDLKLADPEIDPETGASIPKDVTYKQRAGEIYQNAYENAAKTIRNPEARRGYEARVTQEASRFFPEASRDSKVMYMQRQQAEVGTVRNDNKTRAMQEQPIIGATGFVQDTQAEADNTRFLSSKVGLYSPEQVRQMVSQDRADIAWARASELAATGGFKPDPWLERLSPDQVRMLKQRNEQALDTQARERERLADKQEREQTKLRAEVYEGARTNLLQDALAGKLTVTQLDSWQDRLSFHGPDYEHIRHVIENRDKNVASDETVLRNFGTRVTNFPPTVKKEELDREYRQGRLATADYHWLINEWQQNSKAAEADGGLSKKATEVKHGLMGAFSYPPAQDPGGRVEAQLVLLRPDVEREFAEYVRTGVDPSEAARLVKVKYLPRVKEVYTRNVEAITTMLGPYRSRTEVEAAKGKMSVDDRYYYGGLAMDLEALTRAGISIDAQARDMQGSRDVGTPAGTKNTPPSPPAVQPPAVVPSFRLQPPKATRIGAEAAGLAGEALNRPAELPAGGVLVGPGAREAARGGRP